jgi:hypothetical protein
VAAPPPVRRILVVDVAHNSLTEEEQPTDAGSAQDRYVGAGEGEQ